LKQLNINIFHKISNYMEKNFEIEKNLKWTIKTQIEEKKKLRSYKGLRHSLKLPLNGQRTHSNTKAKKLMRKMRVKY
jgi:small subunit ribosomal protein S13